MKKYKTRFRTWGHPTIDIVEAERETDQSIFIGGRRISKRSQHDNYFDTWAEAHEFLTKVAETEVSNARRRLDNANGFAGNVRGMRPPE